MNPTAPAGGDEDVELSTLPPDEIPRVVEGLRKEMYEAAESLDFEKAAQLRDQIRGLTDAELARIFVAGQAAKLVSASGALKEATQEDYKAAQMKRAANAKAALDALKNIPEVAALLSSPSEDNALKLMAAVKKMDLSGQVKLR